MPSSGTLTINTSLDLTGLTRGIQGVSKAFTAAKIGASLLAIAKGFDKVLDAYTEFEAGMAKTSTLFGDVNVNVESLTNRLINLSGELGISTSQLNEGLYNALSSNVEVTEDMGVAMEYLESVTKLATAGFTSMDNAVETTAKIINAYGMEFSEVNKVADILIQTQNRGITTVDELGQYISQVTPTAAALGVAFEDIGAAIATMTASGVRTPRATTYLRQMLDEFSKEGSKASKNLELASKQAGWTTRTFSEAVKSGRSLTEILQIMKDRADSTGVTLTSMFNSIWAGQAATSLTNVMDTFVYNLDIMNNSAGSTEEAFDKLNNTVSKNVQRIVNNFQLMALEIGRSNEGILADIVQVGVDISAALRDAFSTNDFASAFETIFASLETVIPRLINTGLEMMAALLTGFVEALPTIAKSTLETVVESIVKIFDQAPAFYSIGLNMLTSMIQGIVVGVTNFFTVVGNFIGLIRQMWDTVDWSSLGWSIIEGIWNGMVSLFSWLWGKIVEIGTAIKDAIATAISGPDDKAIAEYKASLEKAVVDGTIDTMDEATAAIAAAWNESWQMVFRDTETTVEPKLDINLDAEDVQEQIELQWKEISEDLDLDLGLDLSLDFKQSMINFDNMAAVWGESLESLKERAGALADEINRLTQEDYDLHIDEINELKKQYDELQGSISSILVLTNFAQFGISALGTAFSDMFEALENGEDGWAAFAKAGLEAVASMLDALSEYLTSLAVTNLAKVPPDWGTAALAAAGAIAAKAAAGIVRGYAGSFASGGIVQGPYSGHDNMYAAVKAGETILNHAQAINTAKLLERGDSSSLGAPININFNGDVYGDPEQISIMVYNRVKTLQSEGRLNKW